MNYWQGKQIRLRAIEPEDAEIFHKWNKDSERARCLDFLWPPTSLASLRRWTEEMAQHKLDHDAYHWMIESLQETPVGSIATHHCDSRTGNFSYAVDVAPAERGKGYAGEAVQMVLRYYFEELRYQKATVIVHSYNQASIRLHEKLGFQLEGTLRRLIYTQGQYWDALIFGLTTEEFYAGFETGEDEQD